LDTYCWPHSADVWKIMFTFLQHEPAARRSRRRGPRSWIWSGWESNT